MGLKICADETCKSPHTRKGIFCSDACRKRDWDKWHWRSQAGRVKPRKSKPSTEREKNRAEIISKFGVKVDGK
jgi:hypothetical protein